MRTAILMAAACAAVGIFSNPAHAQTCLGTADVTHAAPVYAGGTVQFASNEGWYLGTVGGGSDRAFGRVDAGIVSDTAPNVTGLHTDVRAGAQIPTRSRRVITCPLVSIVNAYARNAAGSGVNVWGLGVGGGAYVGVVAARSGQTAVIPVFGVTLERFRSRASGAFGASSASDTDGQVTAGVAFQATPRFTIFPAWTRTISQVGGDDSAFRLSATVSFPRR